MWKILKFWNRADDLAKGVAKYGDDVIGGVARFGDDVADAGRGLLGWLRRGEKAAPQVGHSLRSIGLLDTPSVSSVGRFTRMFPKGTWRRRGAVVGAIGAPLYGAVRMFGGQPDLPEFDMGKALEFLPPSERPVSEADRFNEWLQKNQYETVAPPDVTSSAASAANQQRAALNDYLATAGQYGQNQSAAIQQAYKDLSQSMLEKSADVFQRGQVTAADIDRLYETLAAENLGTAYGEGLSTPTSDVAGLAAPAGEAATSADVARTYGGTLADYLGQQAGIESAAIEQNAASQALQGAALAQSLRDYIAMASGEKRFQLESDLAAQAAEAARQQQMLDYEAAAQDRAWKQQVAQQLFGFEGVDRERAIADEENRGLSAATAARIWAQADPTLRKQLEQFVGKKGQEGLNLFVQRTYENPNILVALGLVGG